MKQGTREAMVLSEVLRLNSCIIDHNHLYLHSCQDQQLRGLLDRQQKHTVETFQRLLEMAHSHGIDTNRMPMPVAMTANMGGQSHQASGGAAHSGSHWPTPQYGAEAQQTYSEPLEAPYNAQYHAGTGSHQPQMAQTGTAAGMRQMLNDRVIAEGALMFHKFSAEMTTALALESAEPHLRNALVNMSRNCIEMAYEIYHYMSQRGWYQLPDAPQHFIAHSAGMNQQQYHTQQYHTQ
ncbi:MAG: spore coat protein [Firmicutes bacterium]|nr:spore coat protein [Bacillota bacterium]